MAYFNETEVRKSLRKFLEGTAIPPDNGEDYAECTKGAYDMAIEISIFLTRRAQAAADVRVTMAVLAQFVAWSLYGTADALTEDERQQMVTWFLQFAAESVNSFEHAVQTHNVAGGVYVNMETGEAVQAHADTPTTKQ